MVKVNIHQHQKGKPNLSKKIFGPEATLIQCLGPKCAEKVETFRGISWKLPSVAGTSRYRKF